MNRANVVRNEVIDGHIYLGHSINGYSLELEDLFENMEGNKIDRAIVCPVQPRSYRLESQNDYILEIISKHNDKLIGFCRVDPRLEEDALAELRRVVKLGLQGLLLNPWEEGYRINADQVVKIVALASHLRVPILVESGYPWVSHALQVADLCSKVPQAKIMMSHGGQINISGLAQADAFIALQRHANLFIQTSGVYRQDFLEEVAHKLGAERILFGSASPVMNQSFELKRVLNLKITNEEKYKILGQNMITSIIEGM